MPLPILIVPERHWDVAPKQALMGVLPFLNDSGYDTLCFEFPIDLNEQDIIIIIESTIKFVEDRLREANQWLSKSNQFLDLQTITTMDYSKLEKLLLEMVSTKYSKEMALWFKELPGHMARLDLVKMAKEKNIKICGVDLKKGQLEQINGLEAQTKLHIRESGILKLDPERTLSFKKNLTELQQNGKGVIFVVGQWHYKMLIEEYIKDYLLDEILFLHPYALKCHDSSHIDYQLPSFSNIKKLPLIEQIIHNNEDIEIFLKNIKSTLQPMLNSSNSIQPTSACRLLNDKTKLHFKAYVRPSYLVDCYHQFENKNDLIDTVKKLNEKGVRGFYTFFQNKESYCIPSINTLEVASKIQQL